MRLIVSVLGLVATVAAQGYGIPASINTGPAQVPSPLISYGSYGSPYGIQPSYQQQPNFPFNQPPTGGQAHDSRPDAFSQLFQQNQNQQNSIVSPSQQNQQQINQQPALINQQPLISTVSNHQQPNQAPQQQQQQQQQPASSYYGVSSGVASGQSGPFQTGFAGYPTYPTGYGSLVQTMNNPYIMYGQPQPFEWGRGTMITSQLTQANAPTTPPTHVQERPRNEIAAVGYGPAISSIQPASQAYGTPYYGTQYQQQMLNGPSARATTNTMERILQEIATTTTSTTAAPPVIVTSHPVQTGATAVGASAVGASAVGASAAGANDRSPVHETANPSPAPQEMDPWATISSTVNGVATKKAADIQRAKKDH